MSKKSVQQYKWMFSLLLLVWISKTCIANFQNESTEDFNDRGSVEDNSHVRNNDLNERQHALKRILHEQLEHVTHAEQIEEHKAVDISEPHQRLNSDDDSEEEEEEGEYNPWQDSFQDLYEDGTYVYGHSLPNGVTRYERSFFSDEYKGRVVEGFYTQPRYIGNRIQYELRCYRSDPYSGYRPLRVQYLRRPPIVRRDEEPNVDCFNEQHK